MKQRLILLAFLSILLLFRFYFYATNKPAWQDGQDASFTGRLLQEPIRQAQGRQQFTLNTIRIVTGSFPVYHYGDTLSVAGKVSAQGGRTAIYFPKIALQKDSGIFAFLSSFRSHFLLLAKETLPQNQAALTGGIVVGAKEGFSQTFKEALSQTGTLHIVAASGMNITMLASFVMPFYIFFWRRQLAAVLTIGTIILYAILAQLEPSILRASVMGGLVFAALALGRQTSAAWALLLAGFTMLLIRPDWIGDIGFQLSFLASGGLLFLKPALESRFVHFAKLAKASVVGESIATTIVAQAATLPILLANFHSISLVSILVNALVLWTVPFVMIFAGIAALMSFVPVLSKLLLLFCLPFLFFFEQVILFFHKEYFLVKIEELPFVMGIGYYCLLVGVYLFLSKR